MLDRIERALGADDIERDLGRVHLEREADAGLGEFIEDRIPARGEVGVTVFNLRVADGRETVK